MSKETNSIQDVSEGIIKLIRSIVKEEIKQYNSKQETHYDGLVVAVNGNGTINVEITSNTLKNLPNKTGESLSVGNGVRIYATSNLMTDAYVGVKIT
jgi:hypothetical protein